MIISMLIEGFFNIIIFLVSLLPSINFNFPDVDFSVFSDLVGYLNTLVSFSVILACIAIHVIFDNFSFFMKIVKWIISKFGLG